MAELLGAAQIRQLAEVLDLSPTKKLGQNFVIDANTVRKIVRLADLPESASVLEVGPGLGSLTLGLLEAGHGVQAVEIDVRLAGKLLETVTELQPEAAGALDVINQDALTLNDLPKSPTALVANLPYNVSVPVLLHLLQTFDTIQRALVMVQAEVGQRLAAGPGSKIYGAPSVKAAWYGTWKLEGAVSRQVFWPVPNVDSVLVGFRKTDAVGTVAERDRMFKIVDAAFGQRRKMLRQSLAQIFGSAEQVLAALERVGLSSETRGETLTMSEFLALARV